VSEWEMLVRFKGSRFYGFKDNVLTLAILGDTLLGIHLQMIDPDTSGENRAVIQIIARLREKFINFFIETKFQ